MAVVAVVLTLLETLGILSNFLVVTVTLCTLLCSGAWVWTVTHMIQHSDNSEMNTAAAANVLFGVAWFVVTLLHMVS